MATYKTEQRERLMDFLQHNPDRQFSARQIADSLSEPKISLSAIYRNLTSLESAGAINRSTREGSREIFYQYIQTERCKGSIHMEFLADDELLEVTPQSLRIRKTLLSHGDRMKATHGGKTK